MNKTELKPCPFCGGEAKIVEGEESAYVQCLDVKMHRALWFDGDNNAANEVTEQWNRRLAAAEPGEPDAMRYQRLRILGCAPSYTKHLEDGSVLRFTNLDEFVDADLKTVPSRGEARPRTSQNAGAFCEALPDWGQIVQTVLQCLDATIKNESSREQAERIADDLERKYPAITQLRAPDAPQADQNAERMREYKWFDPECQEKGCQSLTWKGRYESAVKGRADFREAFRAQRSERSSPSDPADVTVENPRVTDNDRDEITVTLGGKELRGWSYSSDQERRIKMLCAREYVEGFCDGRQS